MGSRHFSVMTVDLTAAGIRGMETLDSMTDFQNVLKILNHHNNLVLFKQSLAHAGKALTTVADFIQNNNSLDAEVHRPPITNLPGRQPNRLVVDPGLPDDRVTSLHDPQSAIKLDSSKIFKFSIPILVPPKFRVISNFFCTLTTACVR